MEGIVKKWISVLIASIAVVGMAAQTTDAQAQPRTERPHYYIGPFDVGDPYVFAAGVIVGGAMTGTYFAIENKRFLGHRQFNTGAYALTTVGCMALSPMLASALVYAYEGRMLSHREALGLGADCIVPIIGSWLWNRAYDAHPEWPGQ